MEEEEKNKQLFGLLGKNISYSFSRTYFADKFKKEHIKNTEYVNFDIPTIDDFLSIIAKHQQHLKGMNVTIPYKLAVFPFLDKIDKKAQKIGAVNTIKITKKRKLKGFNTDYYGFKKSLEPLLKKHHKCALILGTGGASKAVAFALKKLGIKFKLVSRNPKDKKTISYKDLSEKVIKKHTIIINCTPIGTHPNIDESPQIPYQYITEKHLLYDLIYNPFETSFLSEGKKRGATIKNGLEMLTLQAEKAWRIWNS